MDTKALFLTPEELTELRDLIRNFLRLPFGYKQVPGNLLEEMIAQVRGVGATRLNTYDFVDVIDKERRVGWQVKSLNHDTPVTWIRAKIPNKPALIAASHESQEGVQALGDAILDFCNAHVNASLQLYNLEQIGYIRLINFGNRFVYFEIPLITKDAPVLFNAGDYFWRWSEPKKTTKKEQLPALHGYSRQTNEKAFAWHGLGENQLHFTGEMAWWPQEDYTQRIEFAAPSESEVITMKVLTEWLAQL